MSSHPRLSVGPPPGGASRAETPVPAKPLPSRSEFTTLLQAHGGPIKSAAEARRWLDAKGWVLAGETYDRTKLSRVLMTVAISSKGSKIGGEAMNAILAVAFLLEDDITDKVSEILAKAVASKVLEHIEPVAAQIASSNTFASANSTAQAETTLALKEVSSQLETVSSSLNSVVSKLASLPPLRTSQPPPPRPTWAEVAGAAPATIPQAFNPDLSDQHTRLQQRLLNAAKTVTVTVDLNSHDTPADRSPTANADLRVRINKLLEEIDKADADLAATDGIAPSPAKTLVRGVTWLKRGAFLLELDTPESAARLRSYALDPVWDLARTCFGDSARITDKTHTLIVRFAPCGGIFDPSNAEDIATLENENGLPPGCITSATWLKKPHRRHSRQTVASLKVLCNSVQAANHLLRENVFIAGHRVVVRKDIREPLRCNNCQEYGHIRASCRNPNRCSHCASPDHSFDDCPSGTAARCIMCGPDSSHASTSRTCPDFLRRCDDLDARFPENSMPFFPSGDPSTWVLDPRKLSKSTPTPTPWAGHPVQPGPLGSGRYQVTLTDLLKPGPKPPVASQVSPAPSASQ